MSVLDGVVITPLLRITFNARGQEPCDPISPREVSVQFWQVWFESQPVGNVLSVRENDVTLIVIQRQSE